MNIIKKTLLVSEDDDSIKLVTKFADLQILTSRVELDLKVRW